ncbi:MAG: hypothetical protein ACO2PN_23435 [Pyrobaculum sp.]|jgi:hypothetical protein
MQRLIGKPEGSYIAGSRCYRVVKLFDECTPRREEISKKAAKLYKGIYAGNCTIIYEVDIELCKAIAKLKK